MSKKLQFDCKDINFISVSAQNALSRKPLPIDFIISVAQPLNISDHAMDVVLMLHDLKPRSKAFLQEKRFIMEDYREWVVNVLSREANEDEQ
jgi:hypothetical protein